MTSSPDISLVLPTRGRPRQAEFALREIRRHAARPERLEVVLYADDDDPESHDIDAGGIADVRIIGSRAPMGEITRRCYEATSAPVLVLINDDIVFQTPGWDERLLDTFAQWPDGIGLVWGNDLCGGGPLHPSMTRRQCELLGGVCPPEYHREYIDTHLWDVFRELAKLGVERRVYLEDVIVEHRHPDVGKGAVDATYMKPRRVHDERTYVAWRDERKRQARLLAKHVQAAAAGAEDESSPSLRAAA